ncbi:hypothetical protein UYSO10_2484 [Kosakonia radicincitans]|nr:hypothetical protein UYSO10_2484 [Kosakonia radicincitans]
MCIIAFGDNHSPDNKQEYNHAIKLPDAGSGGIRFSYV